MKNLTFFAFALASVLLSSVEAVDWIKLCKENAACGTASIIAECKDNQGCYEKYYRETVGAIEKSANKTEKCARNILRGKFKC